MKKRSKKHKRRFPLVGLVSVGEALQDAIDEALAYYLDPIEGKHEQKKNSDSGGGAPVGAVARERWRHLETNTKRGTVAGNT